MRIKIEPAFNHKEDVKELFSEYMDMLIEGDPRFEGYLEIQNYDDELAHLEHKYGEPEGRLYVLYADEKLVGCIGLRKMDKENCELKRLYIKPEFRGNRLGDLLVKRIIMDAKKIGYKHMLLDTLPFLETALKIYKKYGFYESERYNDSPLDTSIYMKLDL